MRQHAWACLAGLVWLMILIGGGCSSGGGSLPYNPGDGGSDPRSYALPDDFAQEQGKRGWSYLQAQRGTRNYRALAWGTSPAGTPYATMAECWRDATAPAAFIGRTILHPGVDQCAVIGWRVPTAGQVQVSATLQCLVSDEDGDGSAVSIWQNAQCISQPSLLPNVAGQSQTVSAQRSMHAGDMLYISLDPIQQADSDWFSYGVTITVQ